MLSAEGLVSPAGPSPAPELPTQGAPTGTIRGPRSRGARLAFVAPHSPVLATALSTRNACF